MARGGSVTDSATSVIDTARRRGVAYGVALLAALEKPRARSPASMPAAKASPSRGSALGGSSSVSSSTIKVSDTQATFSPASIGKPSASRES